MNNIKVAKEKNNKVILKIKKRVFFLVSSIFIFLISICIYTICARQSTYAYREINQIQELYVKNDINLDINSILNENTKDKLKEEIIKEDIDLEYTTIYQNDASLSKGTLQTIQEGRNGKQIIVTKKTFEGEKLIKEECIGNKITKAATNKIVLIGTSQYSSGYKIKIGDYLYTTPETLSVMQEPNINAEKIITLSKDSQVKLLEIQSEWGKIQYQNYVGWTEINSLKYVNKNETTQKDNNNTTKNTKNNKIQILSRDMPLNKPSNLTLEQFKKVLSNNSKDTKKIFQENAQYFYYAEKQYNINGVFLAAVGIHESNWGTSKISIEKKNLFGYGAYDRAPYDSAYNFSNYSESIDLLARVFIKHYLNKSGTKIYNNEIATGKYYNGTNIDSVNKKYATDSNWGNNVYKWMQYLYNKL